MTDTATTPADAAHPHSPYGASQAVRWRACPGSTKAIEIAKRGEVIPERAESVYAAEGTEAHDWANNVLVGKIGIEELPDEFRLHLTGYISYCQGIAGEAEREGGEVLNEVQVPLYYRPEDQGTLDFGAITDKWIKFVDLKYGAGKKVTAKCNDQLAIYVLSLVAKMEKKRGSELPDELPVTLAVYQPRHHSFDGGPEEWEITLRNLKDIGIDIEDDYKRARISSPATLIPTDEGCQFCDLKGVCEARAKQGLDPLVDFVDETVKIDSEKVATLSPEIIASICKNEKVINGIVADVKEAETARLNAGGKMQLMKMVENPRKGNRKWTDDKAAATFLRGQLPAEDRYKPRVIISPAQALTKLKALPGDLSAVAKAKMGMLDDEAAAKSKTKPLVHRADGMPVLVPIDDKRPAIEFKAAGDDFENEEKAAELADTLGSML